MTLPSAAIIHSSAPTCADTLPFDRAFTAAEDHMAAATLGVVLGEDTAGVPVVLDLATAPHLLIAGTTGAGKSECLHVLMTSLLLCHGPWNLRFLLIDTKQLELQVYKRLPHLHHSVVTDRTEAVALLTWLVHETSRRTQLLARHQSRSITDFNTHVRDTPDDGPLARLVVLIDDIADVTTATLQAGHALEVIAKQGRAVGIHLVCVTQRPSRVTVPAPLKSLFASRLAFHLPAAADSRSILDRPGAERLPGVGVSLLMTPDLPDGVQIRNALLAYAQVQAVVEWWDNTAATARTTQRAEHVPRGDAVVPPTRSRHGDLVDGLPEPQDELLRTAAELVIQHHAGSTSMLQRSLRIGYGRAARLLDELHRVGVLGPADGSRPRDVLVGFRDLDQLFNGSPTPAPRPTPMGHRSPGKAQAPPLPLIDRILRRLGG